MNGIQYSVISDNIKLHKKKSGEYLKGALVWLFIRCFFYAISTKLVKCNLMVTV